jgi:hypothetical protein
MPEYEYELTRYFPSFVDTNQARDYGKHPTLEAAQAAALQAGKTIWDNPNLHCWEWHRKKAHWFASGRYSWYATWEDGSIAWHIDEIAVEV